MTVQTLAAAVGDVPKSANENVENAAPGHTLIRGYAVPKALDLYGAVKVRCSMHIT